MDQTTQDQTTQDQTAQDQTAQDQTAQDQTAQDQTAQDGTAQAAELAWWLEMPPEPEDWDPELFAPGERSVGPDPGEGWTELPVDPWLSFPLESREVAVWRERLLAATLPDQQKVLVTLIGRLEAVKSAAAALQARAAVAFETARRQAEADAGVRRSKRGVSVGAEVALARQESPHRGGRLLGLARALVHELPHTLAALGEGRLSEWRATLVARETACLDPGDRQAVDAWLAQYLVDHPSMGDRRLVAEVQRAVIEIDQHAVLRRRAKAAGQRRVSMRPLPDGLVQLTAILPLQQGVATYAALRTAATATPGGLGESRGARMADALVERVTGRTAADPCGVELVVVITDQALLGVTDTAAQVDGYGPMPPDWVRRLIADTDDTGQQIALRRLFRGPGRMVRMETSRRLMSPALRQLIAIRDQACRTPWCGAPIRHADHVQPHAAGGATSLANGQGLCEACNYTKQAPGWHTTAHTDPDRGHIVTLTTPTGHTYTSTQPSGPGD